MLDLLTTFVGLTLLLWGVRLTIYGQTPARRVIGYSVSLWTVAILIMLWRA